MKGFRARPQKSGKVWYYYDTLTKPRREIPLGSDYVAAVRKWSELAVTAAPVVSNFKQLADEYERAALFRRLMLYPTELRAAAKTVAFLLSFYLRAVNAPQIHFDR